MAISLLLPVVSTSQPNLFEIAMRSVPRMRAWRFSSARPGRRALERRFEQVRERVVRLLDRDGHRPDAEVGGQLLGVGDAAPSLEYRDGMSTPVTWSAPSASAAIAATSDESIPPDSPMSTSLEAVLASRSPGCRARALRRPRAPARAAARAGRVGGRRCGPRSPRSPATAAPWRGRADRAGGGGTRAGRRGRR